MTLDERVRGHGLGPRSPRVTAPAARLARIDQPAAGMGGLRVIVIALVLFQRFVVPGTAISIALPVVLTVVAVLLAVRLLRADAVRSAAYAASLAALIAAVLIGAAGGHDYSLGSLLLLCITYLPVCCRLAPALRHRFEDLLRFFVTVMMLPALACCGQWAAQMAGWQYSDLLSFVPPQLLYSTVDFNVSYPIYYGSDIYKANGVVFLEASFASQFLALAIIAQLLLGRGWWKIALFGLALLSTVSGTGLVLLGAGLAVLALRRGGVWTMRVVLAVGVAVLLVAATPLGTLLADRSDESSAEGSSGNARFVAPYVNVTRVVSDDLDTLMVGHGPGTIGDDAYFNPQRVLVNYPALPKLVGEYGLPASLLMLLFLVCVFVRGAPSVTLSAAVLLLFFALTGSLLQPTIIYTSWLLTGLFAGDRRTPWSTADNLKATAHP